MSAQVAAKIVRTANAPRKVPEPIEIDVAQALVDLENTVPELKTELRPLQISAAKEVDVRGGKKAIVVFVPVPQLKAFHKVQQRYAGTLMCKFLFNGSFLFTILLAD
jgi:small subunit ribosomal protein S7e